MKTAGLFTKNGNMWQPSGFTTFSHTLEMWKHDDREGLYFAGGNNYFVRLGKCGEYIPAVVVSQVGKYEGKPARSLETAKKRALELAITHKILVEVSQSQTRG